MTRRDDEYIEAGGKRFDKEKVLNGLKQAKAMDVNEEIQRRLSLIENDTTNCVSDVAADSQKLQHEIGALKDLKIINENEHAEYTDQLSHTTNEFKKRCVCLNREPF